MAPAPARTASTRTLADDGLSADSQELKASNFGAVTVFTILIATINLREEF